MYILGKYIYIEDAHIPIPLLMEVAIDHELRSLRGMDLVLHRKGKFQAEISSSRRFAACILNITMQMARLLYLVCT